MLVHEYQNLFYTNDFYFILYLREYCKGKMIKHFDIYKKHIDLPCSDFHRNEYKNYEYYYQEYNRKYLRFLYCNIYLN